MTLAKQVHCHVCPMKDLCPHSEAHECYKRSQYLLNGRCMTADYDLQKIKQATNNCPLRKVLG